MTDLNNILIKWKGKPLDENHVGPALGAVHKPKKRQYRQYMNRRGGFNRPLGKMPSQNWIVKYYFMYNV